MQDIKCVLIDVRMHSIHFPMCKLTIYYNFNKQYSCSLHGLIRGENMELGRDSDTGGQVIFIYISFCLPWFRVVSLPISAHVIFLYGDR